VPRFPSHLRGKGTKSLLSDVDLICQRYNVLPSDYVSRITPQEHQFNVLAINTSSKRDGNNSK